MKEATGKKQNKTQGKPIPQRMKAIKKARVQLQTEINNLKHANEKMTEALMK